MKGGGLRKDFSSLCHIRYRNESLLGRPYSLVSYGRCNFKCAFCFTAGDEADDQGVFPDACSVDFDAIRKFVEDESIRGNPIRISGGEPALYKKETLELLRIIREHDNFSIVDSNGTNFRALVEFSRYADVLSVDPIKAPEHIVERITRSPKKLCWDLGIETTRHLGELSSKIEFKTMLFEPIGRDYLDFIESILPKNVFWTLKKYLPSKSYFPVDNGAELLKSSLNNGLISPSRESVIEAGNYLIKKHPNLEGRLTCILGSTRRPENYILH